MHRFLVVAASLCKIHHYSMSGIDSAHLMMSYLCVVLGESLNVLGVFSMEFSNNFVLLFGLILP